MLQLILMVTLGVPNSGLVSKAYSHWLGYREVDRGEVTTTLASVWDAPRMAHRQYIIMQPASGAQVYLRFVEVAADPGYVPMRTTGWNAVESLVQDPDGLARRLSMAGSPFKIEGRPRPLGPNSPIRAMQVVGPAEEILYFTHLPDGPEGIPRAKTYVDRPFVVVVGGTSLDAIREFYQGLGAETKDDRSIRARITVLNRAFDLDLNATHPISMARVSPQYSVEMDGYPASAVTRPTRPGELPPAMAMVTFEIGSLDGLRSPAIAPPRRISSFPYADRRVEVLRGAAGELVELVEEGK